MRITVSTVTSRAIVISFILIAVTSVAASGAELDPNGLGFDPFVPFDAIPESELYPKGAAFSVAEEGHLLVNGEPRYLPAVIWYGATELECEEDTPGYVDDLKWLYQAMPGYDDLQRMGIDGIGCEAPMEWMLKLNQRQLMRRRADAKYACAMAGGMPVYVDFTAAEWSHGCLICDERAKAPDGHHFMPYSIITDEGRKVWKTMWTEGAKETLAAGWKPWCYELFNEPACSEEGRAPENLDGIGRIRFIEERFSSMLAEGVAALKEIDPSARACFQPTTMRTRGIDLFEANRHLDVICAPTGGHGGAVEAHLLRALATGKPIVDSEMYVGRTTNSIRQAFLDQYQRGYNVSYMFKWSRRPSDWRVVHQVEETEGRWKGVKFWRMWPEESLKKVGKVADYNFMCPYKVGTDQLLGIRLAKREILDVNAFFTPRDRGVPRRIAVLFSQTTERLAFLGRAKNVRLFDAVVAGLDDAHLAPDVIFEQQIAETGRLNDYKVLVLAGVESLPPEVERKIRVWERSGGLLVRFDERRSARAMAETVRDTAARAGIRPFCEIRDALNPEAALPSVEITPARRGGLDAYMITSRAPTTKVLRFKPEGASRNGCLVRLWTSPDTRNVPDAAEGVRNLVSFRQPMSPDKDGFYVLTLDGGSQFFVYGPEAEIVKAYPRSAAGTKWLKAQSAEEGIEYGANTLAAEKAERAARQPVFDVDPNRLRFVRLDDFADVKSPDFELPWGVTDLRGVRFDFIRYDQNGFKDVIRVEKPVRGVEVDSKAAALYFCYTAAPKITVVYADGTKRAVKPAEGKEVIGLKATNGRTLLVRSWLNPYPAKKIATLDFTSGKSGAAVAGVTVQKPEPSIVELGAPVRTAGGCGVHASVEDGEWKVALDETAGSWTCANADFAQPVSVTPGRFSRLTFEMNRLPDADGNYHDHATPQFRFTGRDASGKMVFGDWRVARFSRGGWAFRTDGDPETWEKVSIAIDKKTVPESVTSVIAFAVQFQMMPTEHSGLAFRNFRLEGMEE